MIVDPWGVVLAQAADGERRSSPTSTSTASVEIRASLPSLANRRPAGLPLAAGGSPRELARAVGTPRSKSAADKRRLILDAAVRVFARQGFHACRVSDIADEAGVAYGLVYHYFGSKDEVLDTLFLERWNVMLEVIREVDAEQQPVREKLDAIAVVHRRLLPARPRPDEGDHRRGHARGQLVRQHAHRHDPRGLRADRRDRRRRAGRRRCSSPRSTPRFAAMAFYGAIEQLLTGWIFGLLPQGDEDFERAKWLVVETVCGGLESRAGAGAGRAERHARSRARVSHDGSGQ